jgi:hypothetical protein
MLEARRDSRREWIQNALALPCALVTAWLAVHAAPGAVRLLSMWVHEIGHASAAWLSGYPAIPGPWFTQVNDERSYAFTVVILGALGFLGFRGWQKKRWLWVAAAGSSAAAVLYCTGLLYSDQAQQLIIFGGDAGCFVAGAMLMASFYARKDSVLHQNYLRWGFLVIGALAFMDAFATWSGGIERVPLGENENGLSDPSVLTELYSWNMTVLRERYYRLAIFCLMVLGAVYVAGLVRAFRSRKAIAA